MAGAVNSRVSSNSAQILQGAGQLTIDGYDVGGFQGGVRITWGQRETFVESDWHLGPVDSEVIAYDFQIATELEEATLENLAMAWGMSSSSVLSGASSKILTLAPESVMLEHQLVFEGMSATDRTKTRVFTVDKAVRIGSSQTTLHRGVKTVIPCTFKALIDSNGDYGQIVDNTITA